MQLAKAYHSLGDTVQLLADIDLWDEVETVIVEHAKEDTLDVCLNPNTKATH